MRSILVAPAGRQGDGKTDGRYRLVHAPSFGLACGTALFPALVRKALIFTDKSPSSHLETKMLPRNVSGVVPGTATSFGKDPAGCFIDPFDNASS